MSTNPNEPKIGLVLLAAGGSRRLGRPKQLLTYRGESLLRRAAKAALASQCSPAVVVLSASVEELGSELAGLRLLTVVNPDWEEGIGGSIRTGVTALNGEAPELDAVLLALCDQAVIEHRHLDSLVEAFCASHPPVAASRYGDTFGAPAVFHRSLFGDLGQLTGDQGAKKIIFRHLQSTVFVDLPEAGVDIDTEEDYARLTSSPDSH
ncbi:nucleotidyltransferase family protein [Methylocaldum sp.]|uniref:nucleotidyltransferase family protein n=1 Tax=Methylocaldum sp. TaxID=1969727 RepID=UPI002D315D32|nr:nucleotidyltransferase family protein [Methylocaldum sp.]HYE36371.1 nucleotidyltransferase family protein [Methylocaldum sp.]